MSPQSPRQVLAKQTNHNATKPKIPVLSLHSGGDFSALNPKRSSIKTDKQAEAG
ncbi:hypothetical protein SynA1560_02035 [Synechococcus sp. A15-60]|nr:hypothetical protein SynA1560_02035 [Synechococcus sp. A15-60]